MKTAYHSLRVTKKDVKILTSLLLVVLLTLPPLANIFVLPSQAANLANYKIQIGDSRSGAATSHTYTFDTPSTTGIKTVNVQYCTTASGTCTAPTGMVITATPTLGTVTGIAGSTYSATGSSTTCTGSGNTDCTLTVTVTTPTTQTAGSTVVIPVTAGITNPTTQNSTYYARMTTNSSVPAVIDGPNAAAFAVLSGTSIEVSATVDPNFAFSVTGVNGDGSATTNGATITSGLNTSANAIPFGILSTGTSKIAAQDITVTTNSQNGYTVTASHAATATDGPLVSGTNDIDRFGSNNDAPAAWSAPAGTVANTNTGFFGYTTDDATLCTGTAGRFQSNKWAGTTTTGQEVACNAGNVTAETTRIGYQAQVNAVQPAGAYTGSVILIATPTY